MTSFLLIFYTVQKFNSVMSIPILLGILVAMGCYFFRVIICARLGSCLPLNLIVQPAPSTLFSRYSEESNVLVVPFVPIQECRIIERGFRNAAGPIEHLI